MDRQKKAIKLNIAIMIMEMFGMLVNVIASHNLYMYYYTEESNLLAFLAGGIYLYYAVGCKKKKKSAIPQWVIWLRYVTSICLAVTFTVVVLLLIPMAATQYGIFMAAFGLLLWGTGIFFHFLCPVLSVLSTICYEGEKPLPFGAVWVAALPTVLYAVVYTSLNVAGVVKGPYPFLYVYEQPWYLSVMYCVMILALAFSLACVIRARYNKRIGRQAEELYAGELQSKGN